MSNQHVSFVGNLTRDPAVRTISTKNGDNVQVADFSVAVNGRNPEDVVYFDCELWGAGVQVLEKWFKKGSIIVVSDGEARMDKWDDKTTGEKRSKMKFRVNRFGFAGTGVKQETDSGDTEGGEEPEADRAKLKPKAETKPSAKPKKPKPPETEEETDEIPF